MDSMPTLPRRSWSERASLVFAGAILILGLGSLLGWWLRFDEVLRPFPNLPAMKANLAVAFALLGGALFAVEFGHRAWCKLALLPAAIGAVTLLEHALAQPLGRAGFSIDEWLASDFLFDRETASPGRMSAMAAICVVLGGLALAWRATERGARARLFTEAVAGSLIASVGFSTLLGYAATLSAVYKWGTQTAVEPISAIALMLLGLAVLLLAWRDGVKAEGGPPSWSPMPAVIGCLTLTVILFVGLTERERLAVLDRTRIATDAYAQELKLKLDEQVRQVETLSRHWSDDLEQTWSASAAEQLAQRSSPYGGVTIAYVDSAHHTVWTHPVDVGASNFDHFTIPERREAILAANETTNAVLSGTTEIHMASGASEPGFAIYAAFSRSRKKNSGYVAADYVYSALFKKIGELHQGTEAIEANYHIDISIGGKRLYASIARDSRRSEADTYEKTYTIATDRNLHIALTPSIEALAQDRVWLPQLALGAGIGISVLLGLSVHLARSARAGQRAAELSNKKLFAENEERRRVEARLKVSDERLRLALDSTQIGIFEWSVAAGHVYYSPGLWAMLGFEHVRMPSTVEAWQSLIHPDDLPLYRRRIESQLSGIATFIEPEYRVRSRTGDWRWVYTRSKSVATAPDGRPTRIIGTVQDITARREAELALRESQAEARKLSLVASKTDNPVLIGSPDGRIEWANEAFCRVMEYSLDEVVGKNPAHFIIGPETNPRTVVRIRAAMAKGHGISTDVVNYSKSGRKYHVHVEIQPVRGSDGRVENFIAVETDITSRVETEEQLRRAKREADDASRAKSDFLASMSHEIRTPMNGVIGMTSLLMETTLNAEQRDYINTIRTSGEALLTIINDILDFSKIESGKMELERAPFELALCVEEALDLFAFQASAKKLDLVYHIAADVPGWIMGDVTRLRQVLVNLINNAVKFTPRGSIALEVRRVVREPDPLGFVNPLPHDPAHITLEFNVRDTGIGIPADRLDRLFKAFSQVDSSTTRKYGGTGLGLAICQRLCGLMGGAIRVQSKAGAGSEFIFTIATEPAPGLIDSGLPALPAALRDHGVLCIESHPVTMARLRTLFEKWGARCTIVPRVADVPTAKTSFPTPGLILIDAGEIGGPSPLGPLARFKCHRLLMFPFGQIAPAGLDDGQPTASISKPLRTTALTHAIATLFNPLAAAAAAAAKKSEQPIAEEFPLEVLLAEDNAVNQKVALRFLERLGYRAQAVANGLEVLTALENRRVDLILMDLQMPEMDGLEASRQIRAKFPSDRQPKIIALTANAMQGDREQCLAAGMDDYVTKPVKMHEISAAIRRQFGPNAPKPALPQVIG